MISPTSPAHEVSIHYSTRLSSFEQLDDNSILDLIKKSTIKSCSLDPLPAKIMRKCFHILVPILKNIVNLSLTSGKMPKDLKSAMIRLHRKKPNADTEPLITFVRSQIFDLSLNLSREQCFYNSIDNYYLMLLAEYLSLPFKRRI